MASSVGVLFYWLRKGDHPEVARQTKGKLPIDNTTNITVARAVATIASIHTISQTKYTITAYEEKTSRLLANPEELLTNYCRIYVSIDSKKIEDLDRADGGGPELLDTNGVVSEDWGTKGCGGKREEIGGPGSESWHPIAIRAAESELTMEKVLAITSHRKFPLMLQRHVGGLVCCPLCNQDPGLVDGEMMECCNFSCCHECLAYVFSSSLYTDKTKCVVCGSLTSSHVAEEAARLAIIGAKSISNTAETKHEVKRERESGDEESPQPSKVLRSENPTNPAHDHDECDSGDDYFDDDDLDLDESGPLRL